MSIALSLPLELSLPAGSLEAYISRAYKVPLLTPEEERELGVRYQKTGDVSAARRLVLAHLRFVIHVARSYSGYGLSQADLIQEGNIGLMKAVKRFDPSKGVRLVTFAVHWVKAEIHEFVLRNWRIVKVATTKAQRKLFFNLRRASKRLMWFSEAEIQRVAEELNVRPDEVREMEHRLLVAHDESFDGTGEEEEGGGAPAAYLADDRYTPEASEQQAHAAQRSAGVRAALDRLDPRSRAIVAARWLPQEKKATLGVLAKRYSISMERVRQVEKEAMKKLKVLLQAEQGLAL